MLITGYYLYKVHMLLTRNKATAALELDDQVVGPAVGLALPEPVEICNQRGMRICSDGLTGGGDLEQVAHHDIGSSEVRAAEIRPSLRRRLDLVFEKAEMQLHVVSQIRVVDLAGDTPREGLDEERDRGVADAYDMVSKRTRCGMIAKGGNSRSMMS